MKNRTRGTLWRVFVVVCFVVHLNRENTLEISKLLFFSFWSTLMIKRNEMQKFLLSWQSSSSFWIYGSVYLFISDFARALHRVEKKNLFFLLCLVYFLVRFFGNDNESFKKRGNILLNILLLVTSNIYQNQ